VNGSPFRTGAHPRSITFSPNGQMFATADSGDSSLATFITDLPNVAITTPASGGTYGVGDRVYVAYTCNDSPYGPGIATCKGPLSNLLYTAQPGTYSFTASAISGDGLSESGTVLYTVVLRAPADITAPSVRGTASAGKKLTCEPGAWSGDPTRYGYGWQRSGVEIAGATELSYEVLPKDVGSRLSCAVTATNALGHGMATSGRVLVPAPSTHGCPSTDADVVGDALGRIRLGMTRSAARAAYTGSKRRSSADADFFCLEPAGELVGYPTSRRLDGVKAAVRRRLTGHVAWELTSNPEFSFDGITPGLEGTAVSHRLRGIAPLRVGGGEWYFVPKGGTTVLLDVRSHRVRWLGIAAGALTTGTAARRRLVAWVSGEEALSAPRRRRAGRSR
jgi:hypothetical protein